MLSELQAQLLYVDLLAFQVLLVALTLPEQLHVGFLQLVKLLTDRTNFAVLLCHFLLVLRKDTLVVANDGAPHFSQLGRTGVRLKARHVALLLQFKAFKPKRCIFVLLLTQLRLKVCNFPFF